jgi:hypothetical protein
MVFVYACGARLIPIVLHIGSGSLTHTDGVPGWHFILLITPLMYMVPDKNMAVKFP